MKCVTFLRKVQNIKCKCIVCALYFQENLFICMYMVLFKFETPTDFSNVFIVLIFFNFISPHVNCC